jgi:hypothetical protein
MLPGLQRSQIFVAQGFGVSSVEGCNFNETLGKRWITNKVHPFGEIEKGLLYVPLC